MFPEYSLHGLSMDTNPAIMCRLARDCPYTFMTDLAAGRYRLPWEDEVTHVDGRSCGFAEPTRQYAGSELPATAGKISRVA